MSEPREEPKEAIAAPDGVAAAPAPSGAATRWRGVALGLAAALLLVIALASTAPFWSGSLPWALPPVVPPTDPRIERLEAALQQNQQQRQQEAAAENAARQRVEQRLGALENRPGGAADDSTELRGQLTTSSDAIADLKKRLETYEYRHERLVADVGDLAQMLTDVGRRLDTIEKTFHARADANTDTAIGLVLLQIREAVAVARPFTAEYEALLALARDHPEIAAAAAPLAEPAESGVAGRAALAERLRGLREAIAAAETAAPPSEGTAPATGWTDQALDRLSRLVQIRRVDAAGQTTPNGAAPAAVDVAAQALAGGDLEAAVAALDELTGAPAAAAAPWLRLAKQRLAVEQQLRRLEALLATRLGAAGDAAAAPGSSR